MIYVAFDVEANGLINPDIQDPIYQPEIIEFGAVKWQDKKRGAIPLSIQIKPKEKLLEEVIKITSITDADLKDKKSFMAEFLNIAEFFTGVDHLVSFNGLAYDLPVLQFNLQRYGLQFRFPWPRYHTDLMLASTEYCQLQGKTGNKSPKLVELHQLLFEKGFDDAHRAINDAEATRACFQELQKRGVI